MRPSSLNATEAVAAIRAGELTSSELVDSCLDRIDTLEPAVNAMITVDARGARKAAAHADHLVRSQTEVGPLHGVPVAIKDLQPTAGLRTTYGSAEFADNIPIEDAPIVARIRQAGAIIVGKTNIPEHSIGANTVNPFVGATGNPFDIERTCGGSSGGSGVAVATEMAALATGSDHGGSLRIPACYSGVVAHRSTPGVVPNELRSVTQTFYSLQGPMARTVDDVALLLSVIVGRTPVDRGSADPMAFPLDGAALARLDAIDPSSIRVGVSEDLGGVLVSESIRRTFRDRMERLAPNVGSLDVHPVDLTSAPGVDWRLRSDLFIAQFGPQATSWTDETNPNVRRSYDNALSASMADFGDARRVQMELYQDFRAIFDDVDILICPGVSVPPFDWRYRNPPDVDGVPVDNYMAWLALSSSLTVVGHPVTALPCGLDETGTPFGLQIVGPMYQDRRLLSVARALETLFRSDPVTARPTPDLAVLASTPSTCGSEGRLV